MAIDPRLVARRDDILQAAARHGVQRLRVFGSAARGEADAASDFDFLVEMAGGRSLLDLGGLQVELEALLGRAVDVVTPAGLKPRMRQRVLEEAVPV